MKQLRLKSIQQQTLYFIESQTDPEIKELASDVLSNIIGVENTPTPGFLDVLYDNLSEITSLGQIFSRNVVLITSEKVSRKVLQELQVITLLGKILILFLAKTKVKQIESQILPLHLDDEKFVLLKKELRSSNKKINKQISTIEGFFTFFLEQASINYLPIIALHSWEDCMGYIFGIKPEVTQEIKQLQQINIKELLLMNDLQGNTVEEVSQKYDGILIYSVSVLTMITGTSVPPGISDRINQILNSLASSTQTILFQQRLRKNLDIYVDLRNSFNQIHANLIQIANKDSQLVSLNAISSLFLIIMEPPQFNQQLTPLKSLQDIGHFNTIFQSPKLEAFKTQFLQNWTLYQTIIQEINLTLQDIIEFYRSVINSINQITADLFKTGFRAPIPLTDIETCEKAGIHLRNITATSSMKKINIPDDIIGLKMDFFQAYEEQWNQLEDLLKRKYIEERSIMSINTSQKLISKCYSGMHEIIQGWHQHQILQGHPEESVFLTRILASILELLKEFMKILAPIQNIHLSSDNYGQFQVILDLSFQHFKKFQEFNKLVLVSTEVSKCLSLLNKKYCVQFGQDPNFILHPDTFGTIINEIPQIIEMEFLQRLIPSSDRDQKLDLFNRFIQLVEYLLEIPEELRHILLPFDKIS